LIESWNANSTFQDWERTAGEVPQQVDQRGHGVDRRLRSAAEDSRTRKLQTRNQRLSKRRLAWRNKVEILRNSKARVRPGPGGQPFLLKDKLRKIEDFWGHFHPLYSNSKANSYLLIDDLRGKEQNIKNGVK
jgi:hypothetical protein